MSVLGALLWKEGREILPKVLVAVALAVVVCLLRNETGFNIAYTAEASGLVTVGLVVMAIVLAMDAVARERSTGTWSFLLDKPVAGATVLVVKFLVGLGGLLLVALAAWGTVYVDYWASLAVDQEWLTYKLVFFQRIDYASMVALSFAQVSLLYALVFIGSMVADHPFKGVAVGVALAVVLGILLTDLAPAIFPVLNRYPLVVTYLDTEGHMVRLATDAARFWVKVLANLGLAAVGLVGAVVLLRRCREAALSWRAVAMGWGVVLAAVFGVDYVEFPKDNQRMPAGVLADPAKQYYGDIAVRGGLAYMTNMTNSGIATANLSNPQQMRLLGNAKIESSLVKEKICVVDSLAYIVGWRKGLPSDSLGVVVCNVGDPTAPTLKGHFMFAAVKRANRTLYVGATNGGLHYWGATDGGLLLVRERGDAIIAEAFALDAEGIPVLGDERVIMSIPGPVASDVWKHRCRVSVRGSRAYIGTERALVVLDVADAHALAEIGRYTLESFQPRAYNVPRLMASDGDRLYVERFWPHELVEFDISDPDQLREVGYLPFSRSDRPEQLLVADGVAYGLGGRDAKVRTWTIAEYGVLIEGSSLVGLDRGVGWGFGSMVAADGYLYVMPWGTQLLAYRLDEGQD